MTVRLETEVSWAILDPRRLHRPTQFYLAPVGHIGALKLPSITPNQAGSAAGVAYIQKKLSAKECPFEGCQIDCEQKVDSGQTTIHVIDAGRTVI